MASEKTQIKTKMLSNKNKILRILVISSCLALFLTVSSVGAVFIYQRTPPQAEQLLNLINQIRLENNLSELELNQRLNKVAYKKALDLLNNNYFSHNSPDGKQFYQWFDEENYIYQVVEEN